MDSIIQQTETEVAASAPIFSWVRMSPQFTELVAAMVKTQGAIEGAKKDQENEHFKSSYADLASVWAAVRKPLSDNGLAVFQWPHTVEGGVETETMLAHVSGQYMIGSLWIPCKMDAHGIGSASTYGRRFSLMAVTGVAPVDDDGNEVAKGVSGMASAGGQFRPPGRRPLPAAIQKQDRAAQTQEAERDGLTTGKAAANSAATPQRIEWATKAIAMLKDYSGIKDGLTEWWKENVEKLEVVETALPVLHEKIIIAYDAAMDKAVAKAAA